MRGSRVAWTALVVTSLIASGCSQKPRIASAPPPSAVPLGSVLATPRGCSAFGAPPDSGEVTYVSGGRLYAKTSEAATQECLASDVGSGAIAWGPRADRVVIGGRESILTAGPYAGEHRLDAQLSSFAVSAPKGTAVVFISPDHAHLMKENTIGGGVEDISFLSRHDEVTYHPAGTHLAVVGEGPGMPYGIWLVTNLGQKPRELARAETARRVYSLSYAQDGFLAFAADHGDHFDVHWLAPSGQIETAYTGREPVDDVIASPYSDSVAYRTGLCDASTSTRAWVHRVDQAVGGPLAGRSTEPAGWLPDGRLAILARASGCEGPGDLYLWTPDTNTFALVAHGADRAAVRAVAPPPPPSPGSPGEAKG